MKNLFFIVLVLITSNVFASQRACSMSMGRQWDLYVYGSAEDFGERSKNRGTAYDRLPDRKVAFEAARKNLDNRASECAVVCDSNQGTFSMDRVIGTCETNNEFPYSWYCTLRARVFCS
jgi:hypothetical protein